MSDSDNDDVYDADDLSDTSVIATSSSILFILPPRSQDTVVSQPYSSPQQLSHLQPISNGDRVKEYNKRFQSRLNAIEISQNEYDSSIGVGTFAAWLSAYYKSHSKNGYVYSDIDYFHIKNYLSAEEQHSKYNPGVALTYDLKEFVKNHRLKSEYVKVKMNSHSNSSNGNN